MTERDAVVRYLRTLGEAVLAGAIEQGAHFPRRLPTHLGTNRLYPCGHPRTPANTVRVGRSNGVRCGECRRAIGAAYRARQAARPL